MINEGGEESQTSKEGGPLWLVLLFDIKSCHTQVEVQRGLQKKLERERANWVPSKVWQGVLILLIQGCLPCTNLLHGCSALRRHRRHAAC